jgi:hypothetical protein
VRETKDLWDLPLVFVVLLVLRFSEWWLRRKWGSFEKADSDDNATWVRDIEVEIRRLGGSPSNSRSGR